MNEWMDRCMDGWMDELCSNSSVGSTRNECSTYCSTGGDDSRVNLQLTCALMN